MATRSVSGAGLVLRHAWAPDGLVEDGEITRSQDSGDLREDSLDPEFVLERDD